ncbi:RPA-interacting protein isoform X2 [Saccopteryx leptura]|uniref:RPA-interacting protein isoform X2 n=1 Tax=Saccopteryx leptura TaxID=249018 RepID=UPI00339C0CA5
MAQPSGSQRRSLYKLVGSPPWKEAFRQGCLERMRNSRDRLLNKYRQAGGSMPGVTQSTLIVQEVMEEEWNALQSMQSCPEALTQWKEPMGLVELEEIQQELIDQGLQCSSCDHLKPAFTHVVLLDWKQLFHLRRGPVNTNLSFITYFVLKLFKHLGSPCFVMQVEGEGIEIEKTTHLKEKLILLSIIMLYKNLEIRDL